MPNWTTNEVTFSSAKTTNIKKIKDIFYKGCPFNQLIEEPKWEITPNHSKYGANGELPIIEELKLNNGDVMKLSKFKSTNEQDLRWYDWRSKNWGTKWDVPKDEIDVEPINNGSIVVEFHTAWSAPYPIYKKFRDKFKDVKIEWWALDEDDDTNGEGYFLK